MTKYLIFLNNSLSSGWPRDFGIIGQLLNLFILFGIVLFLGVLAIYFTRWIATLRNVRNTTKNINILEVISVGYQNTIQLVKVGNKFILIGVSKNKIVFLTEIKECDINLNNDKLDNDIFKKYLNKYIKKPLNFEKGNDSGENK